MSAAYVSGVAAVTAARSDVSMPELRQLLLNSADRLDNLQNKVFSGRRVNLTNALAGTQGSQLSLNPKDDFDVHGEQMTESERWELYSMTSAVQVSGGAAHTIMLKSDGTVWAWGMNMFGQCGTGYMSNAKTLTQVVGLNGVTEISAGYTHNLALRDDGTVWAWGENWSGELGDGTTTDRFAPVQVLGLTDAAAISAGSPHSMALLKDGTVRAWGANGFGQLGDGTTTRRVTPVHVSGLTDVPAISAGASHSLALKSDGTAWAWGYNVWGQLGNGTIDNSAIPVQVLGLNGTVTAVSAGGQHSLALMKDSTVRAWGYNEEGQLGNGSTSVRSTTPVHVLGLNGTVGAISAGGYHSLVLMSDSTVRSWGANWEGQLGDGTFEDSPIPVEVLGLRGITKVCAGNYEHSFAIRNDDTVWAWGDNSMRKLGVPSPPRRSNVPLLSYGTPAAPTHDIAEISAGGEHTLMLKTNGTVWAWGSNWSGQLGDGTTINRITPVQVEEQPGIPLTGVSAISAGTSHSLALKSDGTVWAWGWNGNGQLGNGTTVNLTMPERINSLWGITAISAGASHSLALRSGGTVYAWGANTNGRLGDGTGIQRLFPVQSTEQSGIPLTGVTAVSAGGAHSLALKSDGTVWAWGRNLEAQLGDGTLTARSRAVRIEAQPGVPLTGATAVSAGSVHSLALMKDSTVRAWGTNWDGQLGDGTNDPRIRPIQVIKQPGIPLTGATSVFAGCSHNLALMDDGTVWTWGWNGEGQLGNGTTVQSATPVQVTWLDDITAISAGMAHSLALRNDDTVWAWGFNLHGQLGVPNIQISNVPLLSYGTPIIAGGARYKIELLAEQNKIYTIALNASNIDTFDNITYTLEYDPAMLQLLDFAAQTPHPDTAAGPVPGTPLEILSHANGVLTFTVDRAVPSGFTWGGVLTVLQFRAQENGQTEITASQ
jgi:alpha-tubulin suppressor-like RCC1 family protein